MPSVLAQAFALGVQEGHPSHHPCLFNGGPTRTHALVAGSPAINVITGGTCPPPPIRDQRGVRRPQDGYNDGAVTCDVGSFERRWPVRR
ncbi:MAG TPA: choice-of-anchor Q domain-containing protein [Gammaproteobacteria bacterium]|nr:choice-of-anchor Q domain-containing protein [Gammaproteobacteria bacterium]